MVAAGAGSSQGGVVGGAGAIPTPAQSSGGDANPGGTITPFNKVDTLPPGFTSYMKWTPQGWLDPATAPGTPQAEQRALAIQSTLPDLGYINISNPFNVISDIENNKFISELGPPTSVTGAGFTTPGISSQDASNIWQGGPMIDTASLSNQNVPDQSLHPGFIDTQSAINGYNTDPPGTVAAGWPTLDGQPNDQIQNIWGDAVTTQTSSDPNSPNYWGNKIATADVVVPQNDQVTVVAPPQPRDTPIPGDVPVPPVPQETPQEPDAPIITLPLILDSPEGTWTGPSGTQYDPNGNDIDRIRKPIGEDEAQQLKETISNLENPTPSGHWEGDSWIATPKSGLDYVLQEPSAKFNPDNVSENVIWKQDAIQGTGVLGNLLTGNTQGLQDVGDQLAILWRRMTQSSDIPSVQDFNIYETVQNIATSPNWLPNPIQQALGNIPLPTIAGDNGPAPVEPPGQIAAGWPTLDGQPAIEPQLAGGPAPVIPVTSQSLPDVAIPEPQLAGGPAPIVPVTQEPLAPLNLPPGYDIGQATTITPLATMDWLNPNFPQFATTPDTGPMIPLPPERPSNLAPDPRFQPGAPIGPDNSVAFPQTLAQRYIKSQTPLIGGNDPTLAADMQQWGMSQKPGSWVTFPNNPFTGQPTPPIQVPQYGGTFTALDGTQYKMADAPAQPYNPATMFAVNSDQSSPQVAEEKQAVADIPSEQLPKLNDSMPLPDNAPLPLARPFPGEDLDTNNPMNVYQNNPVAVDANQVASGPYAPNVNSAITAASQRTGLNVDMLNAFAQVESSGNPSARTGSYLGLFQLSQAEFNRYMPGGDIYDPADNAMAAALKIQAEGNAFAQVNGRAATPFDLYMVHQQGSAGYQQQLNNPDNLAWENMYATAEGQQKGQAWAKLAIWGNIPQSYKNQFGNVNNVTGTDFLNMWQSRFARAMPSQTASR